jgi:hypothetical protein
MPDTTTIIDAAPAATTPTTRRNAIALALAGAAGAVLPAGAASAAAPSTVAALYDAWKAAEERQGEAYIVCDELDVEARRRYPARPAGLAVPEEMRRESLDARRSLTFDEIVKQFDLCVRLAPEGEATDALLAIRDQKIAALHAYQAECRRIMDETGATAAAEREAAAILEEDEAFDALMAAPAAAVGDLALKLRALVDKYGVPRGEVEPELWEAPAEAILADAERLAGTPIA